MTGMTGRWSMHRWLVCILDIKYDEPVDEKMLTLLCKQRRIISWDFEASQPRFYPATKLSSSEWVRRTPG